MPNTFKGWFKSVRLILLFYSMFIFVALFSNNGDDLALLGWRISLALSATMALLGLAGSWWVISRDRGWTCFSGLEYVGVWSLIAVESSHAFYVGPVVASQGGDPATGRSFTHLALALAVYLVARRRLRWHHDGG